MPSYNVISKGFRHSRLYDPNGKRSVIVEEKPFTDADGENPKPRWIGDEIKAEKIADEVDVSAEKALEKELADHSLVVAEEEALSEDARRTVAAAGGVVITAGGVSAERPETEGSSDVNNSEQAQADKPDNGNTEVLG